MITARILPGREWGSVAEIFAEHGATLPDDDFARIGVEEDGGQVVSFLAAQLVMHMEPLWQHPAYRGRLSFRRLLRLLESEAGITENCAYYSFSTSDQVARIMKAAGLKLLPWQVWQREARRVIR